MIITFTNWEEWNNTLAKMNAGLVVCPDCKNWVSQLQKIPEVFRNLHYRKMVNWHKERGDYDDPELQQFLERDKEKTEYCCEYCLFNRAMDKTEIDLEEVYDQCDMCGEWVEKGTTRRHKKHNREMSRSFCQRCIEIDNAEYEFLQATAKERGRIYSHNKRTAQLGLVSDLTIEQWLEVVDHYGNKCADCGGDWTDLDHIIPVSKGGGTTKDNVRPLCSHCNNVKHDNEIMNQ
jgi:hypothetical protein